MPGESRSMDRADATTAPVPPAFTRLALDAIDPEPGLNPVPPYPIPAPATPSGAPGTDGEWPEDRTDEEVADAGVQAADDPDAAWSDPNADETEPWAQPALDPESEFPVDSLFLPEEPEPRPWPESDPSGAPPPFDIRDSALGRVDEVADRLEALARRLRHDATSALSEELGEDQDLERLLVDTILRYLEGAG